MNSQDKTEEKEKQIREGTIQENKQNISQPDQQKEINNVDSQLQSKNKSDILKGNQFQNTSRMHQSKSKYQQEEDQGVYELDKNKKQGVELALALQGKLSIMQAQIQSIAERLPLLTEEARDLALKTKELEKLITRRGGDDREDIQRIKDITLTLYDNEQANQKQVKADLQKQIDELSIAEFRQMKTESNSVLNRIIQKEKDIGYEDIYSDLVNSVVNF